MKRPGAEGLRVDVLVPGEELGGIQPVPELAWQAQAVPFFDYLLDAPHASAVLAGGHCIPATRRRRRHRRSAALSPGSPTSDRPPQGERGRAAALMQRLCSAGFGLPGLQGLQGRQVRIYQD